MSCRCVGFSYLDQSSVCTRTAYDWDWILSVRAVFGCRALHFPYVKAKKLPRHMKKSIFVCNGVGVQCTYI